MTAANIADAMQEIALLFTTAWAPRAVELPNADFDAKGVAETDTWARLALDMVTGAQSTLAGLDGASLWGRGGFVYVSVFTPLGRGSHAGYVAAEIAVNAYQGKRTASDAWFRNVRIDDEGQGRGGDKLWWQTNVIAEFTFEQRG